MPVACFFSFSCSSPDPCPPSGAISRARATDPTHVELDLACDVAVTRESLHIESYGRNAGPLSVAAVAAAGRVVTVTTAPQRALAAYTLRLEGNVTASANFVGLGEVMKAPVTLRVDDRYDGRLQAVSVLVSVDPETGVFSEYSALVPLEDADGDHVFTAALDVAVDPLRTVSTADDRLGGDRQAYAARAIGDGGAALSPLVTFEVRAPSAGDVELPLLSVPKPPGPEGLATVHVRVDDRPARALRDPKLRASATAAGLFDPAFPSTLPLADDDGDHVWEGTVRLRIDPHRAPGGTTSETFPYVLFVQSGGADYPGVATEVAVRDEDDVETTLRVGNPALVPVTFRVDVSAAYLDAAGARRGVYPGEAVFLTGELGVAEDAFGQNAADAFGGGENVVLEMRPRPEAPGVWERTLFLPPSRSYGWKAVRCPAGKGCAELNRRVTSSGRAFVTVMKNLVTENRDAQTGAGVVVVDPRNPRVQIGDRLLDYTGAQVYRGGGTGLEPNPAGLPDPTRLFKQELPDLVVEVGTEPVATPVFVVGTWRDVNLPKTLAEILLGSGTFDLNPWDYEAGYVGGAPPSYPFVPVEPSPFEIGDGQIDAEATPVPGGGPSSMNLRVAVRGHFLYVATDATGLGSDHFVFVSTTPPAGAQPAPWGKAGTVAMPVGSLFLASENDAPFAGWFRLGEDPPLTDGVVASPTGVLEGTVDLDKVFGGRPATLYVAVGPWGSQDGGMLYSNAQLPATVDNDGDLDVAEIAVVPVNSP